MWWWISRHSTSGAGGMYQPEIKGRPCEACWLAYEIIVDEDKPHICKKDVDAIPDEESDA